MTTEAGLACTTTVYLGAGAAAVWRAITDPESTESWWIHHTVSTWEPGTPWAHEHTDGSHIADVAGMVIESEPPHRLVVTWSNPDDGTPVSGPGVTPADRPVEPSRVSFTIEEYGEIARLTVLHDRLASTAERDALQAGWAAVLGNLKTYLETGRPLPTPPWEMLIGFVRD